MRSDLVPQSPFERGHVPANSGFPYRLVSGQDGDESGSAERAGVPSPIERDDLPYKVELWDDAYHTVEQVLAVTSNSSIGYGAYYAAVQQFPTRHITLRHKNRVISRSTARGH
jgi:hypothetical protein